MSSESDSGNAAARQHFNDLGKARAPRKGPSQLPKSRRTSGRSVHDFRSKSSKRAHQGYEATAEDEHLEPIYDLGSDDWVSASDYSRYGSSEKDDLEDRAGGEEDVSMAEEGTVPEDFETRQHTASPAPRPNAHQSSSRTHEQPDERNDLKEMQAKYYYLARTSTRACRDENHQNSPFTRLEALVTSLIQRQLKKKKIKKQTILDEWTLGDKGDEVDERPGV
ncbi:hypothetical protein EXIGLDRAFT_769462 [Exidia glandulosa HHB12029]|uniref:Uncharacterized protein n=1 Tax=Exidia glandulosa HHB12029 TaxID=1314781 RepID=A0A165HH23_EXIGL|nr:hypothetical protein EXIGLDRAFT_769462 [Exidia glandulosa HHB12029]